MIWWDAALIAVLAATALAILAAALDRPWIALPIVPVLVGVLLLRVAGVPEPAVVWFSPLLAGGLIALATAGGGPLVSFIFTAIVRQERRRGTKAEHEVLRGGATIGYLERLALVGAVLVGQPAAVAIIVAVKGLGRFTELDSAAARERFIVGTLGSLIWAAACVTAITGPWAIAA
jgi:hypothetical protein